MGEKMFTIKCQNCLYERFSLDLKWAASYSRWHQDFNPAHKCIIMMQNGGVTVYTTEEIENGQRSSKLSTISI